MKIERCSYKVNSRNFLFNNRESTIMTIQVEVSLYPLKTVDPAPIIDAFCRVLEQDGHDIQIGSMSTCIKGESERVFTSLQKAFEHIAKDHKVVMAVKYSNACPKIDI